MSTTVRVAHFDARRAAMEAETDHWGRHLELLDRVRRELTY